MRFLAVFCCKEKDGQADMEPLVMNADGIVQAGNWKIEAGMHQDEKPFIKIVNDSDTAALAYHSSLFLQNNTFPVGDDQTVLVEFINNKPYVQTTGDVLSESLQKLLNLSDQ